MRILLIRLRLVGDVVFTTPALRAVRRRFPDAHLTYLVEQGPAPVVLGNPHLDDVIVVPHRRGWKRWLDDLALARRLRAAAFDLAIDFHGGPRAAWLAWASGAASRIGYVVPGRTWMYTDAVDRPRELRARHSVENQWDLLAPLGIPPPDRTDDPVEMPDDALARVRVDDRLATAGVPREAEIVVIHVSAGNPFRRWPAASFAELGARLAEADPLRRIVFTSGPSEMAAAASVAAAARGRLAPDATTRIVVCGDFDLRELRALIQRAALFIGGDSGPLHVAATTATPVVGLYGPTLAARSAPWRSPAHMTESVEPGPMACRPCDQRVCGPGDFRCLSALTPRLVLDAAERALGRRRASLGPQPSRPIRAAAG